VEARDDSGGYFASGGGRNGANAGVGARYLGNGKYEEDDYDEDAYSDEERSQDSFVPPKPKAKWKIWK
jgi:hypothetical protein